MIDGTKPFGRALLVFFWGGLAASTVNCLWIFLHFDPILIAWLVVLVNILAVTIKNMVVR